jgi:hypothetical protein
MASRGTCPIRTRNGIQGVVRELLLHFKYLGCDITYELDKDVDKFYTCQATCKFISRITKRKSL